MKTPYYALLLVGVLFAAVSIGSASNIEHHMYWGVAAKDDIWSEFDPAFADSLFFGWPVDNDSVKLLTSKFYLIGLTLPDAMLPTQQSIIRAELSALYSIRDTICDVLDSLGIPTFWVPLTITDQTYSDVQTPITFNGAQPNDNFQKMWEMACYARSHNWSSFEKSLIYGAMAHCMQDAYANFYQPSLYGYGFALDAPEAADRKVLNYAETYSELLSGTHIPSWTFISTLFAGMLVDGQEVESKHGAMQFFFRATPIGSEYKTWEDLDFLPVQRFVEAAQAVNYATSSLTQERLESYLHGWAMLEFMLYGYTLDGNAVPHDTGGMVAHPTWSPARIIAFWDTVGTVGAGGWHLYQLRNLLKVVQWFRHFPIIGSKVDDLLAPIDGVMHEYDELASLDDPWPYYLGDTAGLAELYGALPESLKTDSVQHEYDDWYADLKMWQDHAQVLVPQDYQSYSGEVSASVSMSSLEGRTMEVGPSDVSVDGVDAPALARKAGLTGGMFMVPDTTTVRQPGVLDCGFWFEGERVWAPIHPFAQGDPQMASLAYDLVCFDDTRVNVEVSVDGERSHIDHHQNVLSSPHRWQDSVVFDLSQFRQATSCTLWFTIQTSDFGSYWVTMLSSNYDSVYHSCPEICENTLYQQRYKEGDPTRSEEESPFTNPDSFWPYALVVNPVAGYYLSPPTGLTCTLSTSGRLAVELNWTDNSSYEYGYRIEKTVNGSSPTYIGLLPENTQHYEDIDVAFGDTYRYRVWCERDQWASDTTPYAEIAIIVSGELPPTAYNNQDKIVVRGDDVHLTYYANSQGLMYVHSSDGGKTWDAPEDASGGVVPASDASPAIALDAAGTPCILFHHAWENEGGQLGYRLRYWLTWPSGHGAWNVATAFMFQGDRNLSHQPDVEPPVVSFCIWGDSGFAALDYEGCDSVVPETAGTYFVTFCLSPQKTCGHLQCIAPHSPTNRPVMLVDTGGRRVVISTYGGNDDDDSIIRISYKGVGGTFDCYEQDSGHVLNLTGTLDDGSNVLLAWADGNGGLDFGRFVRDASGYTPNPGVEVADTGVVATLTRPRFVRNPLGLPMLVYEYNPMAGDGIWYALRLQPDDWLLDTVFVPDCYTCYPEGFCASSRLHVLVSGSDISEWPPYHLLSGSVTLPWYQFPPTTNPLATWPNSGRKLVRHPEDDGVHVVYSAGGSVLYAVSQDDGETWGDPTPIDCGDYPSIALDAAGLPTIAYLWDDAIFCRMMRSDSSWKDVTAYLGSPESPPGPPAVDRLQAAIPSSYPYCAFPCYNQLTQKSKICLVKLDTLGVSTSWVAESTVTSMDSFVSVACSPDGPTCVAWQRVNRVMCATFGNAILPTYVQVADSAIHPFIYLYGDYFYLVWRRQRTGQICVSSRLVTGGTWSTTSIVTSNGDYPVYSKASTAGWQQWDACSVNDVWAKTCTLSHNLSESENVSSEYPNLDVATELIGSTPVVSAIYGIWTENVFDTLYGVRFRKLDLGLSGNPLRAVPPSHVVLCGQDAASTCCVVRSACDSSAGVRFDCGTDSLSYLIEHINPSYNYVAELTAAPSQQLASEQSVRVRGEEIARLQFGPGRPNVVRLEVPRWCYENGTTLSLNLKRISGDRATLASLKLYAYDAHRRQAEGVTARATPIVATPLLSSCRPNPFRNATQISYALPTAGNVSLRVYDVTGRTVRTLASGRQNAGFYSVSWDSRDSYGKPVPYGVYFYRLDTPGFRSVKKAVVTR